MSIPTGDNAFLHELELNVGTELTQAETGQPEEEVAGVPIDEWLLDPGRPPSKSSTSRSRNLEEIPRPVHRDGRLNDSRQGGESAAPECHAQHQCPATAVWDELGQVTMSALPLGYALESIRLLPARLAARHSRWPDGPFSMSHPFRCCSVGRPRS